MTRLLLGMVLAAAAPSALAAPRLLVDGASTGWTARGSDQVSAAVRRDPDGSVCLEYDFNGVSGYAVLRHPLPVAWSQAFALTVRWKGRGGVNDVQVKLPDASGDNVWWVNRPDFPLPAALADAVWKSRHFSFAWGPAADRRLARTEAVELTVVAGRDRGKGALCTAGLWLEEREPDPKEWPEPQVKARAGVLEVDLTRPRDLAGLALRWPAAAGRPSYQVQASDDGRRWRTLRKVRQGSGGFEALWLPETEARYLRVEVKSARALPRLELRDAAQWPDRNRVLAELARHLPRGQVPRAFLGEQNYWALVGVDGGGDRSALLSEDGALEVGRGGFSLEPAVQVGAGAIATWADVRIAQELREGTLPLPSVRWTHPSFALEISAAAEGPGAAPRLLARYALTNTGTEARSLALLVAVRPWQVNPPQQFLNTPGGARRVERLLWSGGSLVVNDRPVTFAEAPARVTALPLEGGLALDALAGAAPLALLADEQGHASALLRFEVRLGPGETRTIALAAPLGPDLAPVPAQGTAERMDAVAAGWRTRLGRVELSLPPDARPIADTLRTTLGHILMSRDGPALKPGTRSYFRSWIRDGAMMVSGLTRMGEQEAAREFVDWFGGQVFASGKVPCCVDARGADPVVENDSHGQYLFAVAEVWRRGGDPAFLRRHWPVVERVVAYQESLRQGTRTAAFRAAQPANLHGLLPPSISHEGYSDRPAYSYWDDLWALRGYKDAVVIARALGREAEATRWAAWRDEFEAELARSVEETGRRFDMDVLAGAADRGDFDPTSSTAAFDPAQARLSPERLRRTWEAWWLSARQRAATNSYRDYTPYELRNVGALLRLGRPERAHEMLRWFLHDRRPEGWKQWAEVVLPDPREPRFLGDMPHAWVSSDYLRAVLDLFAYEREADGALLVGAGIPADWWTGGVKLRGLATAHGPLGLTLGPAAGGWVLELEGGLREPPAGVRLAWTMPGPLPVARSGGRELRWVGRELVLPAGPARIELERARDLAAPGEKQP